jgi:hypothetical protein
MQIASLFLALTVSAWAPLPSQPPAPSGGISGSKQPEASEQPKEKRDSPSSTGVPAVAVTRPVKDLESTSSNNQEHEKPPRESWYKVPDWWIVCLTAVLAFVTWRLVMVTRRMANDGRESIADTERAYVFAKVSGKFLEGESLKQVAFVTLTNHGRTPALIQSIRIGQRNSQAGFPSEIDNACKKRVASGRVIGAAQEHRERVVFNYSPFNLGVDKNDRKTSAVVYGEILYRDIFKKERSTKFCWSVRANKKPHWNVAADSGLNGFT